MKPSIEEMVAAVKKHALEHYEESGWDILVEAWTDEEIAEELKHCRTIAGAIRKMGGIVGSHDRYRKEIEAEIT